MASIINILLVADSPEKLVAMRQLLDGPELHVIGTTSGREAIDYAKETEFALAIIGEHTPDMEGTAVAASLRALECARHLPVIFVVTGRKTPSWIFEGYDAGTVDFVSSPIDPYLLASKVATGLNVFRLKALLQDAARALDAKSAALTAAEAALAEKDREMAVVRTLDRLTGLPNRRAMGDMLHTEWLRMAREKAPLSVLFVDVDHFRLFSDHYGEYAGGRCLRRVAAALDGVLRRPADLLGRFGSEKFGVILPGTDMAGANVLADNMCRAVKNLDIEHSTSPVCGVVTVSIGVGSVSPGPCYGAMDLIQAADKALYKAKLAGRDRFVYSECESSSCVPT